MYDVVDSEWDWFSSHIHIIAPVGDCVPRPSAMPSKTIEFNDLKHDANFLKIETDLQR